MLCAAKTRIKPSAKLVLLCLAESARDDGRRAWPGPEAMGEWAGVSRARVFDCLKDLQELRLIAQTKRGQKHQRAEYVVFPDGCCAVHGPVSASSGADAEIPVDSPAHRTLSGSQGPAFGSQGPVLAVSGSSAPDASLTPPPTTTPGLLLSDHSPRPLRSVPPADDDCEHGVDRHASCTKCTRSATA
jgi:hypothetical protein